MIEGMGRTRARLVAIATGVLAVCALAAVVLWRPWGTRASHADDLPQEIRSVLNQAESPGEAAAGEARAAARAVKMIRRLGRNETPNNARLLRRLKDLPNEQIRREAILALGRHSSTDPVLLSDVLEEDPSPGTRAAAARSLSRLRNRKAIPKLVEALSDEDQQVRIWAISALNSTCWVRFTYRADDPVAKRRFDIRIIKRLLTTWGLLEDAPARTGR